MKFILILFLFYSINMNIFAEEKAEAEKNTHEASVDSKENNEEKKITKRKKVNRNMCAASEEALEDMAEKRKELEEKESKISEQAAQIAEKEKVIQQQLKQLEDLKKEISLNQAASDSKSEEKLVKLVEALEKMSPKKASELLSSLNDRLAVEGMMRLSSEKLAKVMNLMDVKRSSQLSELLTKIKDNKKTVQKEGGKSDARNPAKDS